MAPTTDYDILSAPTPEELKTKVKTAIAAGWEVYGGSYFVDHTVPTLRKDQFYQTVIKTPPLMQQMLAELQAINTSTANIDTDADVLKSNTGSTATHTANIDRKTPEP